MRSFTALSGRAWMSKRTTRTQHFVWLRMTRQVPLSQYAFDRRLSSFAGILEISFGNCSLGVVSGRMIGRGVE